MDNVLSVPFVFPESVGKQVYKSNACPRSQWREGKSSAGMFLAGVTAGCLQSVFDRLFLLFLSRYVIFRLKWPADLV
jgi:hypothetical protein